MSNKIQLKNIEPIYKWNKDGQLIANFNSALINDQGAINFTKITWVDTTYKLVLNILKSRKNLIIFTDNDLLAHDDYLKVILENNHLIIIELADTENSRKERIKRRGSASNPRLRKAYNKILDAGANVAKFKAKTLKTKSFSRMKFRFYKRTRKVDFAA